MSSCLYQLVSQYAQLGYHRTGSEVDHSTTDWLAVKMQDYGAHIDRQAFEFQRFDSQAQVIVNGQTINSLPLYYEAVGSLNTDNPKHIGYATFGDSEQGSHLDESFDGLVDKAVAQGYQALVVATQGPSNEIAALNCAPVMRNRIPVILVAGHYAETIKTAQLAIRYQAALATGYAYNLVGHWNEKGIMPALVITTPTSGWFNCAAERGTGIAIALSIAQRLALQFPNQKVQLVATSGHELGFLGGYAYTNNLSQKPKAILHLGSCIAALGGDLEARVNTTHSTTKAINDALQPITTSSQGVTQPTDPDAWFGEAQCWAPLQIPMLSIAGTSTYFHTNKDTPSRSTNDAMLKLAEQCIYDATRLLL